MLKQFLDRAFGTWRSEEQAAGDAPDERDGGSRRVDEPSAAATADDSTRVASTIAAPSKYPLSWPARDLARTRRLQSRAETTRTERAPKSDLAGEPDDDPTAVWRPGDGHERDGR